MASVSTPAGLPAIAGTAADSAAPATAAANPSIQLLEHLRALKRKDEAEDLETSAARSAWLAAVDVLMRAIRAWMLPAVEEGLARVDVATVHVDDDDGAYDAPALKITLPGARIVWVRPVGMLRVGAQGIVDVVCGSSRALLVLNRAGVWKVRGGAPAAALVVLDGHTFAWAVGELLP
jgi:hypothetical protein